MEKRQAKDDGENSEAHVLNRKVIYEKKAERINLGMAAAMIESGKYNDVIFRGHSMAAVLRSFMQRAVPDRSGLFGTIEGWYWTSVNTSEYY